MNTQFPEAPTAENIPEKSITLTDLAYLWPVDNAGWLAQRKADWLTYIKPVFKDYPKTEQKLLQQYFTYGIKNEYYPEADWFFLTPYDSVEDFIKIINSSLLGARNRADMIGGFLVVFKRFEHFPWYKHHMTIFIKAYLSDFYIVVKEKRKTLSPGPTYWSLDFVNEAIAAIKSKSSWSPFYLCIDYFISILPFAFHEYWREDIELIKLMQLVDEKLKQGDLTGDLLSFVQALKAHEDEIWQAWNIGEQKIAAGIEAPREG